MDVAEEMKVATKFGFGEEAGERGALTDLGYTEDSWDDGDC